jgi:hypothetical protein
MIDPPAGCAILQVRWAEQADGEAWLCFRALAMGPWQPIPRAAHDQVLGADGCRLTGRGAVVARHAVGTGLPAVTRLAAAATVFEIDIRADIDTCRKAVQCRSDAGPCCVVRCVGLQAREGCQRGASEALRELVKGNTN